MARTNTKPHKHEFAQKMEAHAKAMSHEEFQDLRHELEDKINANAPTNVRNFVQGKLMPEAFMEEVVRITFIDPKERQQMLELGRNYIETLQREQDERESATDPSAIKKSKDRAQKGLG